MAIARRNGRIVGITLKCCTTSPPRLTGRQLGQFCSGLWWTVADVGEVGVGSAVGAYVDPPGCAGFREGLDMVAVSCGVCGLLRVEGDVAGRTVAALLPEEIGDLRDVVR